MAFNTIHYLILITCSAAIFKLLPNRLRWYFLLLPSLIYCGWKEPEFIVPLAMSILINFELGKKIELTTKAFNRRILLWIGLTFNVGLLGLYKYYNGFNRLIEHTAQWINNEMSFDPIELLFPIGISYYCFQAISYLLDLYWKRTCASKTFTDFCLYMAFFPKLLAGPIERSDSFLRQLSNSKVAYMDYTAGFRLMLWGLFKKVVISDRLALITDPIFTDNSAYAGIYVCFGAFLFLVQLYCDFSGYTDIALGSARLFGIRLSQNFDLPLKSISLIDFWKRWHITLSRFVNDYIYKPISIQTTIRFGKPIAASIIALFLSYLVIGMWHGTSYNFAIFGMIHGLFIVFEYMYKIKKGRKWPPWIANIVTIAFVSMTCIFFKSHNLFQAVDIFKSIFEPSTFPESLLNQIRITQYAVTGSIFLIFIFLDHHVFQSDIENWFEQREIGYRWMVYAVLISGITMFAGIDQVKFIYAAF